MGFPVIALPFAYIFRPPRSGIQPVLSLDPGP